MGKKPSLEKADFKEIILLDDSLIQKFLQEALAKDLVVVLKHAPAKIRDIIERNISERARLILREDINDLEEVSLEKFLEAQQRLSGLIRKILQHNKTT